MKAASLRHKLCLPPCPVYDIEGTESWLADMAADGWLLCKDGFFAGLARFERAAPCVMRYRLQPSEKAASIWNDSGGTPEPELIDIGEQYGWHYLARRGQFYIYVTDQQYNREYNTDPQIYALALKAVRRRERAHLFSDIFYILFYSVLWIHGEVMLIALNVGSPFLLLTILLVFFLLAGSLAQCIHLRLLGRKLSQGQFPDHQKNWQKKARRHLLSRVCRLLFLVLWIILAVKGCNMEITEENQKSLADYPTPLPFATIADFAPDGSYRRENIPYANTIEQSADWLAPNIIHLSEDAKVKLPDGHFLDGFLTVDYYETSASWIAEKLVKEHQARDFRLFGGEPSILSCDLQNVDEAIAYKLYYPTVIIRKGRQVIHATFGQTSSVYTMPLAEWAQIMADSLHDFTE